MSDDDLKLAEELFDGRYHLIKEIERTLKSTVYEAEEKLLKRRVAIKLLKANESTDKNRQRFLKEAKILSALQHDNIVKIFAIGTASTDSPYIVMEYLSGATLREILTQQGAVNGQLFSEIFLPVLEALCFAHSKNIVHRE